MSSQQEAYVPPSGSTNFGAGGNTGLAENFDPITTYLCAECSSKVQLKKGDPIRCKECGHRILYKERTRR
jgi:DNA-directed RNA polymerases I, II, and III subunit RPABC4